MTYRTKNMPLPATCEIQTGYTARTRLEPVTHGGVPAIQLRDLGDSGVFNPAGLPRYALDLGSDRYFVKDGDILFRSRGDQNTATTVSAKSNERAVAILPLLILRARRDLIAPAYLAWFINQPATQRYFNSCARGTRLRMIPKSCLEKLEVPVPGLATQKLVVEIDALASQEQVLMAQIAQKRRQLADAILLSGIQSLCPVDEDDKNLGAAKVIPAL